MMLEDYHVVNRAFMTKFLTWEKTDKELEENSKYLNKDDICDSINLIEAFLEQKEEWYRFIGGEYGIGKTSLCKRIVSILLGIIYIIEMSKKKMRLE